MYQFPVVTGSELKTLFEEYEDKPEIQLSLAFLAVTAMRPVETPRLRWSNFHFDDDKEKVTEFTHYSYKPQNRRTKLSSNYYFKELKKPIWEWSPWFSDKIIAYSKVTPKYKNNKIFPWSTHDAIRKTMARKRRELTKEYGNNIPEKYKFFFDENSETIQGKHTASFRLTLYALRRFAFTWHYYMTFNQDAVKTARALGHTKIETTMQHYVMPKEAIGLTQEMVDNKISLDQFIHVEGKNQSMILDYIPGWKERFIPIGQTSINDFRATT